MFSDRCGVPGTGKDRSASGGKMIGLRSTALLVVSLACVTLMLGFEFWTAGDRLIFRDIQLMGLPNLAFLRESLSEGRLPFINLRRGAGVPFLADPQTGGWYLPAWMAGILPPESGFLAHQFLHLLWLGLGFAFLARNRGVGLMGCILAGSTAIAARSHIPAIEWMPILAGTSWVGWGLLAAVSGHPRLWAICLSAGILSGNAYLWVITPILALAGLALSPSAARRHFLLMALLIPLLTAPAWVGYLSLSSEVRPHGFVEDGPVEYVSFESRHLLHFLFPRLGESFFFHMPDGTVKFFRYKTSFSWTRDCYLGILPLLLFPLGLTLLRRWEMVGILVLFGSGIAINLVFNALVTRIPGISQHIHHPATFIQLTVWAILATWILGWKRIFDSETEPGAGPHTGWAGGSFLVLAIAGALGALGHQWMGDQAIDGGAHPLWDFSFKTGWSFYLFLILSSLSLWYLIKSGSGPISRAGWGACTFLFILHGTDLVLGARPALPPVSREEMQVPLFRGLASRPGRYWNPPGFFEKILHPIGGTPTTFRSYITWVVGSGFPNTAAREGFFQLNDYNPPFAHPALEHWITRLNDASGTPIFADLAAISGIRYLLDFRDGKPGEDWNLARSREIPSGSETLKLWEAGHWNEASLLSAAQLRFLDEGGAGNLDGVVGCASVTWGFQGCDVEIPTPVPASLPFLFLPVTPYKGWFIEADGKPSQPLSRAGFGIAVQVGSDTRRISFLYRDRLLEGALVHSALGFLLLILFPMLSGRKSKSPPMSPKGSQAS